MRIFSATRLAYTVILTGIAGALQMQHRRNTTTQNPCADLILRPFGKKTTNHYESLPLIEKKKKNMNQCTLPHLSRLLTSCMLRHVSPFVLPPNGQLELPSAGVGDTRSAIPSHSRLDSHGPVSWSGAYLLSNALACLQHQLYNLPRASYLFLKSGQTNWKESTLADIRWTTQEKQYVLYCWLVSLIMTSHFLPA